MRPAYRDLLCVLLLAAIALVAPRLEPSYRDLWTFLPLAFAVPLLISGLLLLTASKASTVVAIVIHSLILLVCGLAVLGSLFLFITILFAGTAIVIGVPAALLGLNSAATLRQSFRTVRT